VPKESTHKVNVPSKGEMVMFKSNEKENVKASVLLDSKENKVIAKNVNLFKEWGVTSFELPPQYVSSQDGTFLDSIIQNGYAFEDRYDMAMSKNNKYGSLKDLLNALNHSTPDFKEELLATLENKNDNAIRMSR